MIPMIRFFVRKNVTLHMVISQRNGRKLINKMRHFFYGLILPALVLCAFCIALPPFFKSISIFVLALTLVMSGEVFRLKVPLKRILDWRNPLIYLVALYLFYVLSLLWSENKAYGLEDLQIKLPLFLLPLLVYFIPKETLTRKNIWYCFTAFVAGLFIVECVCLVEGLTQAVKGGGFDVREIFYTRLANDNHVAYLALYNCFSLVFLYLMPAKRLFGQKVGRWNVFRIVAFVFLNLFLILLNSRAGTAVMIFVNFMMFVDTLCIRKQYSKSAGLFVNIIILVVLIMLSNGFSHRYSDIGEKLNAEADVGEKITDSVSQRSFLYGSLPFLLLESPVIGFGVGDVRDEIESFRKEQGVDFGRYLNAHNQFLQTAIATGLSGLLMLLLVFLCFSFNWWRKDSLMFLSALCVFGMFMMTESVLERQAGTHFMAFAFCWLAFFIPKKDKKKQGK